MKTSMNSMRPSSAFVGASWATLFAGMGAYTIGLWNSSMTMSEKGYYFAILVLGLFSAISLQKTVRDKMEGIPVTGIYMSVCWAAIAMSLLMMAVGLFNASFELSVKGYYAMGYLLSVYAVVAVQKNVRDLRATAPATESVLPGE